MRFKILVTGIIALAVLSFAAYGIANAKGPDLYVKVVPDMPEDPLKTYSSDAEPGRLPDKKLIESLLPGISGVGYEELNNFSGSRLQLSMECIAGRTDVIIIRDALFKELVEYHYLLNLDGYKEELGIGKNNVGVYKKGGRKDGVHLYGISLDSSRMAINIWPDFDHRIAVVFKGTKHEQTSVRLLKALIDN